MFNDISCGTRDNEEECLANARLVSLYAKKVWYRTMVIRWSRFRREVVFYERGQSTRNFGKYRGKDVVGIRRERMSDFPCYDSIVQRSTQEQRTWPGGWGPQGMCPTGGGGLARVPNLIVCKHLCASEWHTQGRKDELTSCRGAV